MDDTLIGRIRRAAAHMLEVAEFTGESGSSGIVGTETWAGAVDGLRSALALPVGNATENSVDRVDAGSDVREAVAAYAHALTFKVGDRVVVDNPRYRGTGEIPLGGHSSESHIIHLDHRGPCLAVRITNGNIWYYAALTVRHAPHPGSAAPTINAVEDAGEVNDG